MTTDSFDRSNEVPIGGNWTSHPGGSGGDIDLASNIIRQATGGYAPAAASWNASTFGNDIYVVAPWLTETFTDCEYPGLAACASSSDLDGYGIIIQRNGSPIAWIDRFTDSGSGLSNTDLGSSFSYAPTVGQICHVRVEGSTITAALAGSDVDSRTDSTFSTRATIFVVGYSSGGDKALWPSIEFGDVGGGPPAATPTNTIMFGMAA